MRLSSVPFSPAPAASGSILAANSSRRTLPRRRFRAIWQGAATLLLVAAAGSAHAANKVWDGGAGGAFNWTEGPNWDADTAPATGDALFFDGTVGLTNNNDYAAATSFLGITFNPNAGAFTLNGNSITSTGGIVSNSLITQTVNIPLIFTATHTLGAIAGGTLIINGGVSGAGGITKAGGGTVSLTSANTFTGTAALNGGNLLLDFSAAGAPATNILPGGKVTTLAGGSLTVQGAAGGTNSQALGAVTLNSGLSNINVNPGAGGTAALTLASIARTSSANNANVGGGIRFGTTGTITVTGTVNSAILLDGQANPYATYGLDDWAATDGTGRIIAATPGTAYTDFTADTTINAATPNAVRFSNTAAPITITNTNPTNNSTSTIRGILVTSNSLGGTITGGFIRPNRVSTAGATFELFQNSILGDLTLNTNINNASSSTPVALSKNGVGRVVLSNTGGNGYTGQTFINEGTLSISNDNLLGTGTAAVNLSGGALEVRGLADPATPTVFPAVTVTSPRALVFNNNAGLTVASGSSLTLSGVISGAANFLNINGPGTTFFTGNANTYTSRTVLNGGTLNIVGINSLGGGNYGGTIFNGGTLQYAGTLQSSGDISIGGAGLFNGSAAVTLSAGGGAIDTNGNIVTYANSIGNGGTGGLTKVGAGSLALNSANLYSGATAINGGILYANNTAGSATGSGGVNVGAAATLGGAGFITGGVATASNATLAPGNPAVNNGVGTLTLGGLTLADGSIASFEFLSGGANDLVAVTGALTLSGTTSINLLQAGTTNRFASPGAYDLFSYGSISGGAANLAVAGPAAGVSYVFSLTGNKTVRLTITSSLITSSWNVDADGPYGAATNWTNNTVPDAVGATAIFGPVITAPRTITLTANRTVGEIDFNNANAYTLSASGAGALTLNNGGGAAVLQDANGSHVVNVPLTLVAGVSATINNAADKLTLGGVISGTGPLNKNGAGTLALTGVNTFSGGVAVTNGSVQINSASSLGDINATATFNSTNNPVLLEALNGIVTTRNFAVSGVNTTIQVTNAADTYEIDGVIANGAGPGTLTKTGAGTLALGNANTYMGITMVNAGALSLGTGGAAGSVSGNIVMVNSSSLLLNRSDVYNVDNLVSGAGTLTKLGAGNATLTAANTFTGDTVISAGTLTLGNSLALQGSTLNYNGQGGTLIFGPAITAATFGGLNGSQNLALVNTAATPAGVTLTVGGNNASTTYSGILSGTGAALTKAGTGTLTLTGANTYTGATNVNGGNLTVAAGGSINGGAINTANLGGSISVSGSIVSSAVSAINTTTNLTVNAGGSVAFNGGVRINSNGSDGDLLRVAGGTLTATDINIGRNAGTANLTASTTSGFIVSGGDATIGTLEIGTNNSQATALVSSGSLTATGRISISQNTATSARPNVLQISGGVFNSTDTSATGGIILGANPSATTAAPAVLQLTGGTTNAQRISFGTVGTLAGTNNGATLSLNGASAVLYVGSGGIVNGAATSDGATPPTITPAPNNITPTITLTNGTIGALADWSSVLPATIGTAVTFQTSDAAAVPRTITWGGFNTATNAVTGGLSGSGNLTVGGGGTLVLAAGNAYTGTTTINAGTVSLQADASSAGALTSTSAITINAGGNLAFNGLNGPNRVNDSNASVITLAGGRLSTNGLSEGAAGTPGLGVLVINAPSIIDLGVGNSILAFANSNSATNNLATWTARLSVFNWSGNAGGNGVDQFYVGTDGTGLSADQLALIQFYSDNGAAPIGSGAMILGTGEIVPVPEPGAVTLLLLGLLGTGTAAWARSRRAAGRVAA